MADCIVNELFTQKLLSLEEKLRIQKQLQEEDSR